MLNASLGQRILTPLASRQAARPIGLHHLGLNRRQPLACSSGSQMSDSLLGKRKVQDISNSAEGRHASTADAAGGRMAKSKYSIEHTQGPSYKVCLLGGAGAATWSKAQSSITLTHLPIPCQAPGLLITDHTFRVPLDYSGTTPGTINVFCRELVAPVNARRQQPYLLYLQGVCGGGGWSRQGPGVHCCSWQHAAVAGRRALPRSRIRAGTASELCHCAAATHKLHTLLAAGNSRHVRGSHAPCPPPPPAGGPGFESPRPTEASGWLKCALGSFRVVLMDQRGTGRSSPITTNNLAAVGSPAQQAHYLSFFRWVGDRRRVGGTW